VYSLRLICGSDDSEALSLRLWEAGTVAISEGYDGDSYVLTAGFEDESPRALLLSEFAAYSPEWQEDRTDWQEIARAAWPGRAIGRRLFLAPPWSSNLMPEGRLLLLHNPGQASGTGEHPCTQLALEALEGCVSEGCKVLDVGTGSGILAIAAAKLGAGTAIGVDTDETAIRTAKENFELNALSPALAVGSVDCIAKPSSEVTVANISATVLLSILDDLLAVIRPNGILILTGFPRSEAARLMNFLPAAELTYLDDWACLVARLS
jgi:ribosomal protein L11 methyltransferase